MVEDLLFPLALASEAAVAAQYLMLKGRMADQIQLRLRTTL